MVFMRRSTRSGTSVVKCAPCRGLTARGRGSRAGGLAGVDHGDRDHRGVDRPLVARDDGLQPCTIWQAAGTGSMPRCGIAPCNPAGERDAELVAGGEAGPRRARTGPPACLASCGHRRWPASGSARTGRRRSSPCGHAAAFLSRLEHQVHRAIEMAVARQVLAAASSMATWPSWPQACILPGCRLAWSKRFVLGHGSVHVGAQADGTARRTSRS